MLQRDAAPGIHRVQDACTNWYLIEDGTRLTVVDTGLPASWGSFRRALRDLGRRRDDVEAVVLTHGHFDHMGFARRAREELGVPVLCHEQEVPVVAHPKRYEHERSRIPYLLNVRAMPIAARLLAAGALVVKGVEDVRTFGSAAGELDVPGRPRVVFSPGHTLGHCALHLPERDALIAGDAIVTLDPYTGVRGPQIVSGAATADSEVALRSLDVLAATGAGTVLTGHGDPWREGVAAAADQARARGPS